MTEQFGLDQFRIVTDPVGGSVGASAAFALLPLLTLFVLPVVYRFSFSLWARWSHQHPSHDYDPIEDE